MLAVGEVIARHYGHPSQVHQTVMAGATWEQTAAATGGRQRDDGISGVCLYRVPAGWKAAGILPPPRPARATGSRTGARPGPATWSAPAR
jgi:hypothetical protein